ncbi:MAG: nicotinamide-nucleotide amidase [Sulfuricellaceae bacterium]|jgi:nicotinamide-nucleotide amidase
MNAGDDLYPLAEELGRFLTERGWMLATAESCTGGWVGEAVTAVSGSSAWYDRGFITYTNEAKQEMLGVSPETLAAHGAVSEATVREMAAGALQRSRAQAALAVSGIAGPTGGTVEKPVGLVWFAWAFADGRMVAGRQVFSGDRREVRRQAVEVALRGILREGEAVFCTA